MTEANNSLQAAEADCAAVAVAPRVSRVSLADIEASIADKFFLSGLDAADVSLAVSGVIDLTSRDQHLKPFHSLGSLTICLVVMKNGFLIIGKSAPDLPENFNREFGRNLAYEDALLQLWPLMGFALKDRIYQQASIPAKAWPYSPRPE
ncbi:MAG: Gp49 family protein [Hyphomicrobium sp.]